MPDLPKGHTTFPKAGSASAQICQAAESSVRHTKLSQEAHVPVSRHIFYCRGELPLMLAQSLCFCSTACMRIYRLRLLSEYSSWKINNLSRHTYLGCLLYRFALSLVV